MIELPEAATIAEQLTEEVAGRKVTSVVRGNTAQRFAFYSGPARSYKSILPGSVLGYLGARVVCTAARRASTRPRTGNGRGEDPAA